MCRQEHEERAIGERLTVLSKVRKAAGLRSRVLEVQHNLENIRGKRSGVQAIHVSKHDDARPPLRREEDGR